MFVVKRSGLWPLAIVAGVASFGAPLAANAADAAGDQGSGDQGPKLQEVVVTAQKREERLQDVPISLSVLSTSQLESPSVTSVADALNQVPGVATFSDFQTGGTQVTVRGVTASGPLAAGSSPVGYYVDSVPWGMVIASIAPNENAYDLARVEVLRGPQGTLYGASSEGGLVRVLTNDPKLDAFELKSRVTGFAMDGGGGSYGGDAAVNVPIVDGKLAARAVVGYEDLGGWIDSNTATNVNTAILRNYRLKIAAEPVDGLSIGLSGWSEYDHYGAPSISNNNNQNNASVPQPSDIHFDSYGLNIGYTTSQFSVSSESSYLYYSNSSVSDVSTTGGTAFLGYTELLDLTSTVLSEELVLNSAPGSAWVWTAGAIYRDEQDRLYQTVDLNGSGPYFFGFNYGWTSKSYAIYGDIGRRFFHDTLEWILGARYFSDDVGTEQLAPDFGEAPGTPLIRQSEHFNATTPRAVLQWYPNSDLMVYTSYSQGFRSGQPQTPAALQAAPGLAPLKPDKLSNYEIGAKGDLMDKRLSMDLAVYYMDWRDIQQQIVVLYGAAQIPVAALVNGQSASGMGVDFSVTVRPLHGLDLGITSSWNNLTLDAPVYSGGVLIFNQGDRLNYSPEYTGSAFANYSFQIGAGLTGLFAASGNYTSKMELHSVGFASEGDALLIGRASFSLSWADHWQATAFVNNFNNERGHYPEVGAGLDVLTPRIPPRTFGIQAEYKFR